MRLRRLHPEELAPGFGALAARWEATDESFRNTPFGVMWCVVPADGSTSPDRHPERELVVVMAGSGTFHASDQELDVRPGHVVLLDSEEEHVIRNRSSREELRLLSFYWHDTIPKED